MFYFRNVTKNMTFAYSCSHEPELKQKTHFVQHLTDIAHWAKLLAIVIALTYRIWLLYELLYQNAYQ